MRRLAPLLLICILALPACKSKKKRALPETATTHNAATGSALSSMIEVADPRVALQLGKGFHSIENNAWRWTAREFSATLRPPKDAAQKGATLVLKFVIPDVTIQKLKSIQLSASVNGSPMPAQEYTKPGGYTYSRDVASTALQGDAVRVDFSVDKALPPSTTDVRELGLIVSAIGFEAK